MGMTQSLSWWRRLLKRGEMERHLDAELRFHFDGLVADNLRAGMSEPEARRSARLEFGGVEQVKEECRDARGTRWIEDLWQDLCYGARVLGHAPRFTLGAVAVLALGVGVNLAEFQVFDAIIFHYLDIRDADSVLHLTRNSRRGLSPAFPHGAVEFYQTQSRSFAWLISEDSTFDVVVEGTRPCVRRWSLPITLPASASSPHGGAWSTRRMRNPGQSQWPPWGMTTGAIIGGPIPA
jgi:putative ABC transport system permease protein